MQSALDSPCKNGSPGLRWYLLLRVPGLLPDLSEQGLGLFLINFDTRAARVIKLLPREVLAKINRFSIKQLKGIFTVDFSDK